MFSTYCNVMCMVYLILMVVMFFAPHGRSRKMRYELAIRV